jgi:general stress protein 26
MSAETQLDRVLALLEDFSTAMLITHAGGETLHARPMEIADREADGTLWFITTEDSAKAHEIEHDRHAHIVCQKDHAAYLSISGHASLSENRARIAEIWKEPFRVWFPDGPKDPKIALIVFRPQRAEFWDNTGTRRLEYLWESVKAYATGKTPDLKEGEQHGVVAMR